MSGHSTSRLRRFLRSTTLAARVLFGLTLAVLLVPSLIFLCSSAAVGTTLTDPTYLAQVLRETGLVRQVRDEFVDGLVETMDLPPSESGSLREALAEGIRVEWLEAQSERILAGTAAYLASDQEQLSIEIPVVELKVYLLAAIRKHMGQEAYLQAALVLQDLPDVFDLGAQIDTTLLDSLRPAWRAATLAPLVGSGLVALLSTTLWLTAGGRVRGVAVVGGVWLAAGLAVVGAATAAQTVSGQLIAVLVPGAIPELGSVSLHELATAGVAGLRSEVLATGVGATLAGLFMVVAPRAVREKVELTSRAQSGKGRENPDGQEAG